MTVSGLDSNRSSFYCNDYYSCFFMSVDRTDKMNLFGQYAGAAMNLNNVKNLNGFGAESGSYMDIFIMLNM